jgi:hypothetical protein
LRNVRRFGISIAITRRLVLLPLVLLATSSVSGNAQRYIYVPSPDHALPARCVDVVDVCTMPSSSSIRGCHRRAEGFEQRKCFAYVAACRDCRSAFNACERRLQPALVLSTGRRARMTSICRRCEVFYDVCMKSRFREFHQKAGAR